MSRQKSLGAGPKVRAVFWDPGAAWLEGYPSYEPGPIPSFSKCFKKIAMFVEKKLIKMGLNLLERFKYV